MLLKWNYESRGMKNDKFFLAVIFQGLFLHSQTTKGSIAQLV